MPRQAWLPHVALGRKQTEAFFGLADQQPASMVPVEGPDGCPPHGRQSYILVALPAKMLGPRVAAGMEQGDVNQGVRVRYANPIGLPQVTARTGPGQVVRLGKATLRGRKNRFDVKGGAL